LSLRPTVERTSLIGTAPGLGAIKPESPHLVVVEESSSFPRALPASGEFLIGRGPEADLQLSSPGASRRHAVITLADGEVRVRDLGSRNGTLVNGARIEGEQPLFAGDTITIGTVALILYLTPRAGQQPLVDARTLRRRLQEELDRASLFDRPAALFCLLVDPGADREVIRARVDAELRRVDQAGWLSAVELVGVLPEVDQAAGAALLRRVLEGVRPVAPAVRAGLAVYPSAACEPDALLAAARAAARGAGPDEPGVDPDQDARVEIGGRSMVVADATMRGLLELIRRLARTDLPVLVEGETGVGKENAAFALHAWSPRGEGPFVPVNCAAFSENLVESELFGSEKGAFSGAVATRAGLLESAAGGTLFFDEIGELPLALQPKLLRVLESKRAMRVGGTRERELDVRVVAATNRNLAEEVARGRFRADLLFRLNAATVVLPPLRNRPREIAVLARTFLADACRSLGMPGKSFASASLPLLAAHPWPGNVRELKNVVEYLAATTVAPVIDPEALRARLAPRAPATPAIPAVDPPAEAPGPRATRAYPAPQAGPRAALADEIRALERARMLEALEQTGWVQTRAADLIGMPLRTFQQKVKQHGLARPRPPSQDAL
jgi:two-component system, NtrC family, response regulator AtoC